MARDTCRLSGCQKEPLGEDAPAGTRGRFCSPQCDVKYEHLKADARDARQAAEEGW